MLSWENLGSTNSVSGKTLAFTPSDYKEFLLIVSNNGSRVLASSLIPYPLVGIGSSASGGYHQGIYSSSQIFSVGVTFTSTGAVLFATDTTSYAVLLGR